MKSVLLSTLLVASATASPMIGFKFSFYSLATEANDSGDGPKDVSI